MHFSISPATSFLFSCIILHIFFIKFIGTGTPVGDPIETNTLGQFFTKYKKHGTDKIAIGSVKTNIGHLESAAGVTGLIKILLMMKHGLFVPSLHCQELNPKIEFSKYGIAVSTSVSKWLPDARGERLGCINSFGFGGTNSHAIVKQISQNKPNALCTKVGQSNEKEKHIIVVSANDTEAMKGTIDDFCKCLQNSEYDLTSLSYTSTVRRDHFRFRTYIVADSVQGLKSSLEMKLLSLEDVQPVPLQTSPIIFVFCGVGTAWNGMCADLISKFSVFREIVTEIDRLLQPMTNWSISDILEKRENVLDDPIVNHIAIFTCQIALLRLWNSFGIYPQAVVAQSVGEVAAAYAAGALSLDEAVRVIFLRSKLLASAVGGQMSVIRGVDVDVVEQECKAITNGKASIAVYISQDCCTVSGDEEAVNELKLKLNKNHHITCRDLGVKCAYHSHYTHEAGTKLQNELNGFTANVPNIPVFSSVTGKRITTSQYGSTTFWVSNVREPVKFHHAVSESASLGDDIVYIEVGPSPVLRPHLSSIIPDKQLKIFPSMAKGHGSLTMYETVGEMYAQGYQLSWPNIVERNAFLADIPRYVFNKRVFFEESNKRNVKRKLNIDKSVAKTCLEPVPNASNKFCVYINEQETGYIFEHLVESCIIIPGALYGNIGLEVGKYIGAVETDSRVSWDIKNPLALVQGQSTVLNVQCKQAGIGLQYSVNDETGTALSVGSITPIQHKLAHIDIEAKKLTLSGKPADEFVYIALRKIGIAHGQIYQIVNRGLYSKDECFAEVLLTDAHLQMQSSTVLHPVIIDGMLQCCCSFMSFREFPENTRLLPIGIGSLVVKQSVKKRMFIFAKLMKHTTDTLTCNVILLQENGIVVAEMENVETRLLNERIDPETLFYNSKWEELNLSEFQPTNEEDTRTGHIVVVSWNKSKSSCLSMGLHGQEIHLDNTIGIEHSKQKFDEIKDQSPCVVFAQGFFHNDDDFNAQDMYKNILSSGKTMLYLIQKYTATKSNLVVVTESTQENVDDTKINLFGGELWGLGRSVAMERVKLSINFIDVFPSIEENIESLKSVIPAIQQKEAKFPEEILIVRNKVFFGSIHRGNGPNSMSKRLFIKPSRELFESTSKKYIECKSMEKDNPDLATTEKVQVSLSCKNPLHTGHQSDVQCYEKLPTVEELWKSKPQGIQNVQVVERIGTVRRGSKNGKPNQEVICCFPGKIQDVLNVPKQLMCKREDYPNYTPGFFQTAVVALHIAELFREHRSVLCICDEQNTATVSVIRSIVKPGRPHFEQISSLKQIHQMDASTSCIVVLSELKWADFQPYMRFLGNISALICPRNTAESIPEECTTFKVVPLTTAEVFEMKRLPRHFRHAQRLLKSAEKDNETGIFELHENGHIMHGILEKRNLAKSLEVHNGVRETMFHHRINEEVIIGTNKAEQMFKPQSSYVVIGGLSGLGWLIVKSLAKLGVAKIFILSRRELDPDTAIRIENVESLNSTQIIPLQVDICNIAALQEKFKMMQSQTRHCPIKGIFHGGAVTADGLAAEMDMEKFELPLRPKVLGTLNLHQVSRDLDLDHFVMHSSVTSLFGNTGQCNYAAGNAFQDVMASFRRSIGLPAQSIRWGSLDIGLASDSLIKETLKMKGFNPIPASQIFECLTDALQSDLALPVVAYINWTRLAEMSITPRSRKFHVFLSEAKTESSSEKVDRLSGVHDDDTDDIMDVVASCVARVFAIHHTQIQVDFPIVDFGLDSQKGIELAHLMFAKSNVRVPYVYIATQNHTIRDIAQFIRDEKNSHETEEEKGTDNSKTGKFENHWDQYITEQLKAGAPIRYRQVVLKTNFTKKHTENLRKALQHLGKLHPDIRTRCRLMKDDKGDDILHREVVDMEEFVLPFKYVGNVFPDITLRKANDASLRIVCGESEQKVILKLLFCPLTFDMQSVATITDCTMLLISLYEGNVSTTAISDMLINLHDKRPKYEELVKFDDKMMQKSWTDILAVRGEDPIPNVASSASVYSVEERILPELLTRALQQFIRDKDITLYQLVCCFIHIALHCVTGSSHATLLAQADMRSYLGIPTNTIGMYSNIVPITQTFGKTERLSFAEYVKQAVTNFSGSNTCMAYPFSKIKSLGAFDITIHQTVVCSFLDLSNLEYEDQNVHSITSFTPGFTSIAEMELDTLLTSTNLQFLMRLRAESAMGEYGRKVLDVIVQLTEKYIMNPDDDLEELLHGLHIGPIITVGNTGKL